ncbi:MAG: hypothetical protein NT011_13480 [Kiritimatiellaeota bacterium]|nr:hypothetical protein [Kiritimatiellota bacterium]
MSANLPAYIAGPAIVTFDTNIIYSRDDIIVSAKHETWDVNTSRYGKIDTRNKSLSAEVTLTPVGQIQNLTKFFPYSLSDVGKKIFPAVDLPLVIHSIDGTKYTFARAAMIKMPSLKLAATDTFFGSMSFLCLRKSAADPAAADSFLKVEAAAFTDATFDETKIASPGYTAAYGTTPYDVIESLDGFTIDIGMDIIRDYVDRFGCVSARLKSLSASAKFTPAGLTEAQWATLVALDGASTFLPGQSHGKAGTDLVITGGTTPMAVSCTIHKCGISGSGLNFGEKARLGELEFAPAKATWTAGVPNPLWTFAVA